MLLKKTHLGSLAISLAVTSTTLADDAVNPVEVQKFYDRDQPHTLSALGTWEIKNLDVGLNYNSSEIFLGGNDLYDSHTLTPSVGFQGLQGWYHQLSYAYLDRDLSSLPERDAEQHSVGADNYYFFMVSSDGYYTIGKFIGGNATQLGQSEMQYDTAIHTGLAVNHLRADCIGSSLTFYINGEIVAQAQDGDLSEGDVGLLAGTFAEPGVDVIFDNYLVSQP